MSSYELTQTGRKVFDSLHDAAALFAKRNAEYKDNFREVGKVMAAMFPNGITLEADEDFVRWHIWELMVVKMTRYSNNYSSGGHRDSLDDLVVYAAMLAAIDEKSAEPEEASQKSPYRPKPMWWEDRVATVLFGDCDCLFEDSCECPSWAARVVDRYSETDAVEEVIRVGDKVQFIQSDLKGHVWTVSGIHFEKAKDPSLVLVSLVSQVVPDSQKPGTKMELDDVDTRMLQLSHKE